MNKRSSPRFPVTLDATVTFPDGTAQQCAIRDYCSGGMYLLCQTGDGSLPAVARGNQIQIHFAHPTNPQAEAIRIEARAARIESQSLGVTFLEEQTEAVVALSRLAAKQAALQRGEREQVGAQYDGQFSAEAMVQMCREKTLTHVRLLLKDFYHLAHEELYQTASLSSVGGARSNLFAITNALRDAEGVISKDMLRQLERAFAVMTQPDYTNPHAPEPQPGTTGLALLESDELDKWLAIRALASRVEERLEEHLEALEVRLLAISLNPITMENNPVGPFIIASLFHGQMQRLTLDEEARRIIFDAMGLAMVDRLQKLYEELNESLIAHGVLPSLAKKMEVVNKAKRPRPGIPDEDTPPRTKPAAAHEPTPSRHADTEEGPPPPAHKPAREMRYTRRSLPGIGAGDKHRIGSACRGVQRLRHMGDGSGVDAQGAGEQAGSPADDNEQALREYIQQLFAQIRQQPWLTARARQWYATLEPVALQAALLDGSVVEENNHPLWQLLDRLEPLSLGEERDELERIDRILAELAEQVTQRADCLAHALEQLAPLLKQHEQHYGEKLGKLLQECEHAQQLSSARKAVLDDLNHRLGHREVPELVLELLDSGWKNLLLRTWVKSGAKSGIYLTYLQVIDQFAARLTGSSAHAPSTQMDDARLLEWSERMLRIISSDERYNHDVMAQVRSQLDGSANTRLPMRRVTAIGLRASQQAVDAQRPAEVNEERWEQLLADLRRLPDREYLLLIEDAAVRPIQLVWRDEELGRYVFADGSGEKVLDLHPGQLARRLYQHSLSPLSELALSLSVRANCQLLLAEYHHMFERLSHDPLTGLLNRAGFHKALVQACEQARSGRQSHILACLDLDHFAQINERCGRDEGDALLRQVASAIGDALQPAALVGRLEGNTFAILLRDCRRSQALIQLNKVRAALRQGVFQCRGEALSLAASIGVSEVNAISEQAGQVLEYASTAMRSAKQQGRNNIQVHQGADSNSAQHGLLDSNKSFDDLFAEGFIQLHCQPLVAQQAGERAMQHYAIVLKAHDHDGRLIPQSELLSRAEHNGSSVEIDRHVVDEVLPLLRKGAARLSKIASLFVGLSEDSLRHPPFVDDLLARLTQEGLATNKLCLGIPAALLNQHYYLGLELFRRLGKTGCRCFISGVDADGLGCASLQLLPVAHVALASSLSAEGVDDTLPGALHTLIRVAGKQSIATEVASPARRDALRAQGLDLLQGDAVEAGITLEQLRG